MVHTAVLENSMVIKKTAIPGWFYPDGEKTKNDTTENDVKRTWLGQNYPNPFDQKTVIIFSLAQEGQVVLSVFDILGFEVTVLLNESKKPGKYNVEVRAQDFQRGVYFYKMVVGDFSQTKKFIVM